MTPGLGCARALSLCPLRCWRRPDRQAGTRERGQNEVFRAHGNELDLRVREMVDGLALQTGPAGRLGTVQRKRKKGSGGRHTSKGMSNSHELINVVTAHLVVTGIDQPEPLSDARKELAGMAL